MTRRPRTTIALVGLILGLASGPGSAQVGSVPVLSGVFPPGATVGQAIEWAISGRNLSKVQRIRIAGGGVEVLEFAVKDETSAKAKVRVASDASPGFREVRLEGTAGVSNLTMVRVDRLKQVLEVEPNDEPEKAQVVEVGTALIGVLKPIDLDHFRIKGTPGQRVTLDLEARRVGTSISPVVTVYSTAGVAIAQGRELRGGDGDCRMTVVLPPEGACVVQVRDNVYGGNDLASYRLRVDPGPFATGLFPLGGPRGKVVEVELSGGNLVEPRRKTIRLPDSPGTFVDPGAFDGPEGPVSSPARLIVGDGPEMTLPSRSSHPSPIEVASGVTINGRVGEPGEVDAYLLKVKAGDKIRARVEADSLGSWLDSVLAIRDEKGAILAENDDSRTPSPPDRALEQPQQDVDQRADQPDSDHTGHHDRRVEVALALHHQIADPGRDDDELGADQRLPS